MNIHHLELFYFVAKHGGIAAAVRNIPYGIQQPAVSGQIAKLEESLGTKLFQRRTFALSPTGTELFEFIRPFFENIDFVAERLRQNSSPQLRIAAPAIVLHDYLPQILQRVRAKSPAFRLYLHEATRTDAERLLLAREVDLAKETQSLRVRVIPSLGDPASAALVFLNPLLIFPAAIAQKILKDPLGHIFAFNYSVTGTWADPKVAKRAVEARAVEHPATPAN